MDLADIGIVTILILLIAHLVVGHSRTRPSVTNVGFAPPVQFPSPMESHNRATRDLTSSLKYESLLAKNAMLAKDLDTMTTSRQWLQTSINQLESKLASIRKTLG